MQLVTAAEAAQMYKNPERSLMVYDAVASLRHILRSTFDFKLLNAFLLSSAVRAIADIPFVSLRRRHRRGRQWHS